MDKTRVADYPAHGHGLKVSEEDAKTLGIREFAMKPMDSEKLAVMVRKVLDGK